MRLSRSMSLGVFIQGHTKLLIRPPLLEPFPSHVKLTRRAMLPSVQLHFPIRRLPQLTSSAGGGSLSRFVGNEYPSAIAFRRLSTGPPCSFTRLVSPQTVRRIRSRLTISIGLLQHAETCIKFADRFRPVFPLVKFSPAAWNKAGLKNSPSPISRGS